MPGSPAMTGIPDPDSEVDGAGRHFPRLHMEAHMHPASEATLERRNEQRSGR